MRLTRLALRISFILALLGLALGVIGTGLVGASIYLNLNGAHPAEALAEAASCQEEEACAAQYTLQLAEENLTTSLQQHPYASATAEIQRRQATVVQVPSPALIGTPTPNPPNSSSGQDENLTMDTAAQRFKPIEDAPPTATQPRQNPTPTRIKASTPTREVKSQALEEILKLPTPTPDSLEVKPQPEVTVEATEPAPSTVEVEAPPPAEKQVVAEPAAAPLCPASSSAAFELIPIEGQTLRDHPADVHGDLNLALRGYIPSGEALGLITYEGNTDGDAPQLAGLFEPNRAARIQSAYRINDWIWDSAQCGGHPRGCPGPPANTFWPVTLVGLAATPGEAVYPPERSAQIYSGGYTAVVLYAEAHRITLGYTRRSSVAVGYVVHLEEVCVNPNLVALYRAQLDAEGWNDTGRLPALRNNQALGQALSFEIKVAIRDAGSFMDPRSQKDWWR
jgi:hypothetical protein